MFKMKHILIINDFEMEKSPQNNLLNKNVQL